MRLVLRKINSGARYLKKIKEKNESLLIVNLIGTTFVTIAISSIGTLGVSLEISKQFWISGSTWAWIAVLVVSWIVLFIWEIVPKILGVRYLEQVAFTVAPIYRLLMILFFPVTRITGWFIKVLNFITWSKWDIHGKKMSSEEFEAFIDMSHEKWAVETEEHKNQMSSRPMRYSSRICNDSSCSDGCCKYKYYCWSTLWIFTYS